MPIVKERQYRNLSPLGITQKEKRINSDYYVEGYATTFNPYLLFDDFDGPVYEKFERTAFDGCDMSDIIFQYDHQGKVLARLSNKTLIVECDNEGLFICADLSKSRSSQELYEEINNGLVTKMSWCFIPQEYHWEEESRTIVHTKIKKIFDVSAVSIPANDGTEIYARNFVNGEIDKVRQELQRAKDDRERLKLQIILGGF